LVDLSESLASVASQLRAILHTYRSGLHIGSVACVAAFLWQRLHMVQSVARGLVPAPIVLDPYAQ
jgi:hypothetical protein